MIKSQYLYIIIITFLFAKVENFEGFISHHRFNIYALGQYENDLMIGDWIFYRDSTKTLKIASGSFLNGNGTNISKTGIPFNGRDGEWNHYYNNTRYSHKQTKNQLKSYQNWNEGVMNGQFISYYRDGKKSTISNYKNGKRSGVRKEWYSGGFQATNLYRVTKFRLGNILNDKVYTHGNRKLIISEYKKDSHIDSIFQSQKGIDSNIFIVKSEDRMKIFHNNGKIYNDIIIHSDKSGIMKSYYDNGQLIIEEHFDSMGKRYWKDNRRTCYNPEGEIIDNIKFIDGKINGITVELMTKNMKVNSNFDRLFSKYISSPAKHYRYFREDIGSWIDYENNSITINNLISNKSMQLETYGYGKIATKIRNSYISIGPFHSKKYNNDIYYSNNNPEMNGLKIKTLDSKIIDKLDYCIGYGSYDNDVRIGKWHWNDKEGNRILEGHFSKEGYPIGRWHSNGINEVLTFSESGELIGTMRKNKRN